jgi:hypothetical protein
LLNDSTVNGATGAHRPRPHLKSQTATLDCAATQHLGATTTPGGSTARPP